MSLPRFLARVAVPLVLVLAVHAEQHTMSFVNQCGFGKPVLIEGGKDLLNGASVYTSQGPWSGIAYLQTGYCNTNGENCTLMEMTMINPQVAGGGSSADLSLIPPHRFSVQTSFSFYNGCDGQGRQCNYADCVGEAFFKPDDNVVQVACQTNNANLLVAYCANASEIVLAGGTAGGSFTGTVPISLSTLDASGTPSIGPSFTPTQLPSSVAPSGTGGDTPTPTDISSAPLSSGAPYPPTATETTTDGSGCGAPEPTATPTNSGGSGSVGTNPTSSPSDPSPPPTSIPTVTGADASGSGSGGSDPTSSPTDTSSQQTVPPPPPTPIPSVTGTGDNGSGCGTPEPTSPIGSSGQPSDPAPLSTLPASQTPPGVSGLGQSYPVSVPSVTASGPGVSTLPASQTPASVSGLGSSQTSSVPIPSFTASGSGVSAPSSASALPSGSQCAPNPWSNTPSNTAPAVTASAPTSTPSTPSSRRLTRANGPANRHRRSRRNSY